MGATLVVLLSAQSCLLPPPAEEVPAVENNPPRVVPSTPNYWTGPKMMSTTCEEYRFKASVTDPDDDDALEFRVFLDYHRLDHPFGVPATVFNPDENLPLEFTVNPQEFPRISGQVVTDKPHMVELLVADRPFYNDDTAPSGRAVEPDGLTASFVWTVQLTHDEDQACVELQ